MQSSGAGRISVIVPVYNGERYLAEALDSALVQTHPAAEVIVVDDGSTDGSAAVAERYGSRVRLERQPHGGIGAARNHGLSVARSEYFAFLDADDLFPPDRLAVMMAGFEADPSPGVVAGLVQQFLSPELAEELRERIRCPEGLVPGRVSTGMLVRRDVFGKTGLFSTDGLVGVDMRWYMSLQEGGVCLRDLNHLVLLRRLHDRNNGVIHMDAMPERLRILKAAIDRRRKMAGARAPQAGA